MNQHQSMQFLGSELKTAENLEASAKFQVVPCPMEKTVSYGKGTANGPSALIEASQSWKDPRFVNMESLLISQSIAPRPKQFV
jgi:arginase family enzyme